MAQRNFKNTKIYIAFTEATSRQQLNSGDNIATLFGKIKKFLSDLKTIAFSGSYNDLSDTPNALPADGGNADTVNNHFVEADVPSDAVFTDTVYSLPVASSTLGGVKTTSSVTSTSGLTACPIISGVPYYKDTNTTYEVVSTTANGLCPKRGGTTTKFLRDDGTWAVPELDESVLSGYLPLTGGMTTGTTGLAGNFRVYVGDFTRVQFLLNGSWATVITGDNTNNGIIVGTLGLNKAAFNVDDPSHAYVNSYPIYSAGYKPFATGSFGKSSGAVTIDCGFKPSYVVIFSDTPSTYIYSTGVSIVFTLNNTGFVVSADIPSGKYSYIAFR